MEWHAGSAALRIAANITQRHILLLRFRLYLQRQRHGSDQATVRRIASMNESLIANIVTYAQILKEASTPHVCTWKPFFVERCTQWCVQIESELLALSDQEATEHLQAAMARCQDAVPGLPQLLDAKHELYKALIKNIYVSNEMYWTVVSAYDFLALATSPRQENLIQRERVRCCHHRCTGYHVGCSP
ncbi:hypothetical protein BJV82DRAFT_337805 [Fennellomyces sp. T-0311]|nr:hypothetical protein BJV82DRAFT_337805 [Fennellomyces sp. T-0311]